LNFRSTSNYVLGNNKDQFGFYQVGDFKTYSKIEAVELHRLTGHHPQWNFNQEIFSLHNWQQEPVESIEELYARRAHQIRNHYDHVVLMFSGGADSTNILKTFVDNRIPFDELLTFNYHGVDQDPLSFFHSELTRVTYPKIEQLRSQGVKFYHRAFDLSEIAHELLTTQSYKITRGYYGTTFFGTSHLAKTYIRERTPDYQRLAEAGKRVVFVWGAEKPRLYQVDGRYCLRFLDLLDTSVAPRTQLIGRENEYDELFYWSPNSLDIMTKQGHMLKRFFEKHKLYNENQDRYISEKKFKLPSIKTIFDNDLTEDRLTFRDLINKIIYPDWNVGTFTVGKPNKMIISTRDEHWNKDQEFRQHTVRLIQHIKSIPDYWKNNPKNIFKGVKLCISPPYFLE